MLAATRTQIEGFLRTLNQPWREDSSNRHLSFTRNRIRHELLPLLEGWNPRLREHLAQMADLARDEEEWWQAELARLAPQVILAGKPVRGGGRAASNDLALDISRLRELPVPCSAAWCVTPQQGSMPRPISTPPKPLRALALAGRAGQKLELAAGLRAERTHRELRLSIGPVSASPAASAAPPAEYAFAVPGEVEAPAFGIRLRVLTDPGGKPGPIPNGIPGPIPDLISDPIARRALLRNWKPGDRVRVRYSSGPRKVKEVLERMKVTGSDRASWPVLELDGRIVWMKGIELEPEPGLEVSAFARLADPAS